MVHKRQEAESSGEGSPLWMVSFSDCMTLLMSFFLVLATFSSSGSRGSYDRTGTGVGTGKNSLVEGRTDNGAIVAKASLPDQPKQGSETVTAEAVAGLISAGGKPNPKQVESYANKVFHIPSDKLFYGKSDVLTEDGRELLKLVGQYVKNVRARIVISESGIENKGGGVQGLPRSLAILRFLVNDCGISANVMCVSVSGTACGESTGQRRAEIALLERSTYR